MTLWIDGRSYVYIHFWALTRGTNTAENQWTCCSNCCIHLKSTKSAKAPRWNQETILVNSGSNKQLLAKICPGSNCIHIIQLQPWAICIQQEHYMINDSNVIYGGTFCHIKIYGARAMTVWVGYGLASVYL